MSSMEKETQVQIKMKPIPKRFVLGQDYYINEEGNWVFTGEYHLKRGYCCDNGCKHCPYSKP